MQPSMCVGAVKERVTLQNPRMKVPFMSGYIDDSVIRQRIQEKEAAILQKPFSPLNLAKKAREALNGLRVS